VAVAASLARLRERALGDMLHQLRRVFQVPVDIAKLSRHTPTHTLVATMCSWQERASDGFSVEETQIRPSQFRLRLWNR
jgi:hypothetical protein